MKQVEDNNFSSNLSFKTIILSLLLTSVVAGLASYISVMISESYYSVAPYHYDSVSYRLISIRFYRVMQEKGLLQAIVTAIPTRDDLDVTLRLIFAPWSLLKLYGHLVVLIPFMIGFFTLMLLYVYSKTASWLLSLVPPLFLFTFPQVYNPVQGIADYWKDNIAIWIIGCLVMTLILSDYFRSRWWSFVCGTMFGLLVLQRAGVVILLAILLLPLLAVIVYFKSRQKMFSGIREGTAYFLLPAIVISGLFLMFDLEEFYIYNFKAGYDYMTLNQAYKQFIGVLKANKSFLVTISLTSILTIYVTCKNKISNNINLLFSMSVVILFPLEIICLKIYYHSTLSIMMVFILISIAMIAGAFRRSSQFHKLIAVSLIILALALSLVQYKTSAVIAKDRAIHDAPWRKLDEKITGALRKYPAPYNLVILYDEVGMGYLNHAFYNEGIQILTKEGLNFPIHLWKHDSYYEARLGGKSYSEILKHYIDAMQKNDGTFAVSYCNPEEAIHKENFGWDGKKIALPLSVDLTRHIKSNVKWKEVDRFNSSEGNLCVYRVFIEKPEMSVHSQ